MYIVLKWDSESNDFIRHSWHKNKEYADTQRDVLENSGHRVRIIHEGKIIYESRSNA